MSQEVDFLDVDLETSIDIDNNVYGKPSHDEALRELDAMNESTELQFQGKGCFHCLFFALSPVSFYISLFHLTLFGPASPPSPFFPFRYPPHGRVLTASFL